MPAYVVRKKIDKSKSEPIERFHGVPLSAGMVDGDFLAKEICESCSLTEADVIACISALGVSIRNHLRMGDTVYLKGIGQFSVSASSPGFNTPEECTPAKVKAKRIYFKGDRTMRSILAKMKYRLSKNPKKK